MGGAEPTEDNRAVVTEEAPLIEVAISNLVLDLTLYGQRSGEDVGPIVYGLTRPFARSKAYWRNTGGRRRESGHVHPNRRIHRL